MKKRKSGGLVKSTVQRTGIFIFSTIIFSLISTVLLSGKPAKFIPISSAPVEQSQENTNFRKFEVQFHSISINSQLHGQVLADVGIDKVLVRVFQDQEDSGGLFFSNSEFRVIDPVFDRLISEFPENQVDLYAWMIARRFNWVQNSLFFDYMYENNSRKMIRKFDLFNPDAITKIVAVYRELAGKRIKGILIQDDFFIRHNEGFSNWGKAAFTLNTNFPAREDLMINSASEYSRYWTQIKVDQINKVLSLILKACREGNPLIEIGMNVHYETPYYFQKSRLWYAHQLTELVRTGIDYIYLMSYHRQMKKEMKLSESENQILFKKILENAFLICGPKLVVKLQVRDWETSDLIPIPELRTYLDLIPENVKRVCFTPVKETDFDFIKRLIKGEG